jgi:superfamily II DNA or RNA helicase
MYSEQDIIRAYSYHELDHGRRYVTQGRVLTAVLSPDGSHASGQVQGSERRPYDVTVRITYTQRGDRTTVNFGGRCSCPLGGYCKHAVALLYFLIRPVPGASPAAPEAVPAGEPQTDRQFHDWLERLDRATGTVSTANDYPDAVRRRLLYVLAVDDRRSFRPTALVLPQSILLTRAGRANDQVSAVRASTLVNGVHPKYYRPIDKTLLSLLWAAAVTGTTDRVTHDDGRYPLTGDLSATIMGMILDSGRGRWERAEGPVLVAGGPRPGLARWEAAADGVQRFRLDAGQSGVRLLPLPQPWYLDPATGETGPLEVDLPPHLLSVLLSAPPVPPAAAGRLRRELERKLPAQPTLLPQAFGEPVIREVAPVPCLRLFRRSDFDPYRREDLSHHSDLVATLFAVLSFDYAGIVVRAHDPRTELAATATRALVVIPRQSAAERTARRHLETLGFCPKEGTGDTFFLLSDLDDPHWAGGDWNILLAFLHHRVPELRAAGWRVELDDEIAWDIAEPEEDGWLAEVTDGGSGIDWFGLSLGITVDGERVDLLPVLLPLLRALPEDGDLGPLEELAEAGGLLFARINERRVVPLAAARIRPLLVALYELYRVDGIAEDGSIRLTAARAAELAEIAAAAAAAGLRWFGGERLLEAGRRMRDFSGIAPVPVPDGLRGTLRPYQQEGVNWLQFLRDFDFAGILADDMGLGKTIQTLTHLLVEQQAGRLDRPALVIAPTSLMTNWRMETARFAPSLRLLTLHGAGRKAEFEHIADHDLVLTTYPLLSRDKDILLAREWSLLILDEAQTIKNPKAQATLIVQQLRVRHRLCLTGTPMENNLGELWSLFHFLMPGLLGSQKQFQSLFRLPIEKQGNARRQQDLARRIRPFLLRRTKQQVAAELPEKTEIIEHIELDSAQRDLYESIRLAMDAKVRAEIKTKGLARSHIIILEALLKLRQVCCDPRLLKLAAANPVRQSAKLERLMEMLPELIADGRRILLFSQFTTMLGLIETELARIKMPYAKLTGQTRDRAGPIETFQTGTVPVFLISLKAGGTGLNLTAADTVIHYDPWWNPAVERQATDRAHRIGQDKAVFVYKLVTAGTVETAILDLQARKQALADGLYDPETNQGVKLTEDDLAALFAPLT